jgi:hypothetical protein
MHPPNGTNGPPQIMLRHVLSAKHGMAYGARACAVSRTVVSPAQPGETERTVSGSTAHLTSKDEGDKSMPIKR